MTKFTVDSFVTCKAVETDESSTHASERDDGDILRVNNFDLVYLMGKFILKKHLWFRSKWRRSSEYNRHNFEN
jgi:hypothetical protein